MLDQTHVLRTALNIEILLFLSQTSGFPKAQRKQSQHILICSGNPDHIILEEVKLIDQEHDKNILLA